METSSRKCLPAIPKLTVQTFRLQRLDIIRGFTRFGGFIEHVSQENRRAFTSKRMEVAVPRGTT